MKEIESKYRLCSRMDFLKLLDFLALAKDFQTLENFYLDTKDRDLASQKKMLRLRKGADWKLTLKGPGIRTNGVLEREELEFSVDSIQAKQVLNNGKCAEILEKIGLDKDLLLEITAHSAVKRHLLRHNNMEIAVDHVMLDDGYEYFEVEVEGKSAKTVQQRMADLIEASKVCANPSIKSKHAFALQHTKS